MSLTIQVVDAFASGPFTGNPAAVCVLDRPREPAWMQSVAAEMNLSETAFLLRQDEHWSLRWFTPKVEVDLCGHATLASAHVLWEAEHLARHAPARFETRSGVLTCVSQSDWIEMDFPAEPAMDTDAPQALLAALGTGGEVIGRKRNRMDYLVEVGTEAAVRGMRPDFAALAQLPVRGVIVTASSTVPRFDFVSRFFAPAVGVNEDPVTGSAHCCLGPYWAERLGKAELTGFQASARGGVVRVGVRGDRVRLAGQAVTVVRGALLT